MNIFSTFVLGFLIVKAVKSFLDELPEQPKAVTKIEEPRIYNVKYYSEGKLLSNPFYKEYEMIAMTVADSWIYEEKFQDLVNENHDAPIIEVEWYVPFKYTYSYTFKHVFLANSYLEDQKNYLENLN